MLSLASPSVCRPLCASGVVHLPHLCGRRHGALVSRTHSRQNRHVSPRPASQSRRDQPSLNHSHFVCLLYCKSENLHFNLVVLTLFTTLHVPTLFEVSVVKYKFANVTFRLKKPTFNKTSIAYCQAI